MGNIQMSCFHLASLALFFFLSSLEKSFALQAIRKDDESNNLNQYHFVHLNSLFPSSSCGSSKGPKRKASLEVVHREGPCSQLNHNGKGNATILSHDDIMKLDIERVKYIHSRLSKSSVKELESTTTATLPAKSGILIGSGNYVVVVGLGTPKRDLSLEFDTGSDLTWTQCQPCAGSCYTQQDAIFDPSNSSSYTNISCTSSLCTQLSSAGLALGCSSSTKACIYGSLYGDNSTSVGYFSRERLTITATATDIVEDFLFGCGQDNEGLFNGSAGILGLGRHPISFVQQTSSIYNKTFSYCLPSTSSSTGHLSFGAADNGSLSYTPLTTISNDASFYGLDIVAISVGGVALPVSSSSFSVGGAIIDSGTTITRLPQTVYAALRSTFRRGMVMYPAPSKVGFFDTCYDFSGYTEISFPAIDFTFAGNVTVELPAVGILVAVSAQQLCLAFTANDNDTDVTIFGNVQQKTLEVLYDVGGEKIGFGAGGCK